MLGQAAVAPGKQPGCHGTHRRAFGRRKHAGIDAADDRDENHDGRPDRTQRSQALGPRQGRNPAGGTRRHAHVNRDHRHIAQRRKDAGNHRGCKQLGDVLLRQDGVNYQHDRGRDQDAQGAAGRERAGRQGAGIAGPAQFGQRHLAHGRRGGERGAADRSEARACADCSHSDATLAMPEESFGGLEQSLGHAADRRELPHQQEQRHDRQRMVGELDVGQCLHLVQYRRQAAIDLPRTGQAQQQHRKPDWKPEKYQKQQDRERPGGQRKRIHQWPPPARIKSSCAVTRPSDSSKRQR